MTNNFCGDCVFCGKTYKSQQHKQCYGCFFDPPDSYNRRPSILKKDPACHNYVKCKEV